ncbi:unnamed protein product [Darwinula stevensoni]|uniref:Kinesin motor domain-containing protein n=1 Tax=Darwinula stevensoni TaxID=69355 RepID=A0A7R9FPV2_9CRUS|nr:unnamed protein product [Darwinula stevensoni]CAG0898160.1 unnamed protein product [Darwinula stevensoni]
MTCVLMPWTSGSVIPEWEDTEPDSLETVSTRGMTVHQDPTASMSILDPSALLQMERCAHRQTKKELEKLEHQCERLRVALDLRRTASKTASSDADSIHGRSERSLNSLESLSSVASSDASRLIDELRLREMTISQLRSRVLHLEKARMDKVPIDASREIARLQTALVQLERVRDELTLQNFTLKTQLTEMKTRLQSDSPKCPDSGIEADQPEMDRFKKYATYRKDPQEGAELRNLRLQVTNLRSTEMDLRSRLQDLEDREREYRDREHKYQEQLGRLDVEMRNMKNEEGLEHRALRSMEQELEKCQRELEGTKRYLNTKEDEVNALKLDCDTLNEENNRLKEELNNLLLKERDLFVRLRSLDDQEKTICSLKEENRLLREDYNRERVLRKKYFNAMEDLKGKIRVYCRVRPPLESEMRKGGGTVVKSSDEFSVSVETPKGEREFYFDRVFLPDDDQATVFQDTHSLVQSAMDGYNVCICAYGQTGSGKTFTMLGTEAEPGIAPRAFQRIFQIAHDTKHKFHVKVTAYMLELYNDRLLDLLRVPLGTEEKLEAKKDKTGMVYVQGATIRPAYSAADLCGIFDEGVRNRHTATTRMNVESSRSHLIIGVQVENTCRLNGTVFRGKLSLLDLAGSERVAKSGASSMQLREANCINKSLSALGDVISALATEQNFVPYRNSKLTQLMQDSLGGNAKTLMIVNVSPAAYNAEETLISLMYSSRVKLITNSASKYVDSREVARLKSIIAKLRRGEDSGVEDEV